jgi:hypothetical protein
LNKKKLKKIKLQFQNNKVDEIKMLTTVCLKLQEKQRKMVKNLRKDDFWFWGR